jgi:tryptophan-rich sensory protein
LQAVSIAAFVVFAAMSYAPALMGALFRPGTWYEHLNKPAWRPPNWLFAPVWAGLYFTIAVAGWLVWSRAGLDGAKLPLVVYCVQLVLNAAWTPIFFGLHRPGLALLEILVLWLAISTTIFLFYPLHAGAAVLMVPYLAWVSFAAVLNMSIWRRNSASGQTA